MLRFHWKTHESCGSDDPIDGRKDDEESDCNHLRVSGYRRRAAHRRVGPSFPQTLAAKNFNLNLDEMEDRHHLTFDTYEVGKLTLEEYLSRVVFYEERPFTRDQFRKFMFAQSKPYPEMIELVRSLKARHGLKIVVVSNEARELNSHRIRKFKLDRVRRFLYFLLLCPLPQARRGHLSACAGHRPGASRAGSLYR